LRCIYTDKPGLTHDNIIGASYCAKKYQVESLRSACLKFSKQGVTAQTACLLYEKSPELAIGYIEQDAEKVFKSKSFLALSEKSLLNLLRNSKLDIKETNVFKAVVKWGHEERARRNLDDTPDNLRLVLKNVLLLVRFPLFTTEEISLHVTKMNLLTPEQLLGVFSFLGGNKASKVVFPTGPREAVTLKWGFDRNKKSAAANISADGTTATIGGRSGWALGSRGFKKGVSTWRVTFVSVTGGQYMTYGVSAAKSYFDERASYTDPSFYGVDTIGQWYSAGQNQGAQYITVQRGNCVDIKLDQVKRTLSFLNCQTQQRHDIAGVPDGELVPHFHMNRNGAAVRVQAIKPGEYGKAPADAAAAAAVLDDGDGGDGLQLF